MSDAIAYAESECSAGVLCQVFLIDVEAIASCVGGAIAVDWEWTTSSFDGRLIRSLYDRWREMGRRNNYLDQLWDWLLLYGCKSTIND
jgi:hypothetical protein